MTILEQPPAPPVPAIAARPRAQGKFVFAGDEKLYVRGVTYGTFRPGPDGLPFPGRDTVEQDFAAMAAHGINAVRTYTPPPPWMLDAAARHGLRVAAGLNMERLAGEIDGEATLRRMAGLVRKAVARCAGHPAVLWWELANEIPAPLVRWHGRERTERYLSGLYRAVKAEDPEALVTYVNYPTSEYLQLPFLDLVCFNVYLESQPHLEAYLSRLHHVAGDRPLVLSELGLDSLRNGEAAQAETLRWQVQTAFAAGSAGAFVYAWTDEWHRGGEDVHDWCFGITQRDRQPKPALAAVAGAFADVPFPRDRAWPRISVVVCSYNGGRTIGRCMEGIRRLDYPDFELIVIDDGSADDTAAIARAAGARVISTENRGLSRARNTGLEAATGDIVAYLDDDACPDPHWLMYLAHTFQRTGHAAVGGPALAPPDLPATARSIGKAPGNPVHVLLSDHEAEHLPGCNLAIRRDRLAAIGGFDAQYRVAGDDVDVCWRLRERGWTLGFSPAAMVWHLPRATVRAFLRQQAGYGKAEAMLELKWPEKYNAAGHLTWVGRVYGQCRVPAVLRRNRIYQGVWGTAPFQRLYEPQPGLTAALPLMPEWHMITGLLLVIGALGLSWPPLLAALPLAALAGGASVVQALRAAGGQPLVAALHLLQPVARLRGRLSHGRTPWRRRRGYMAVPLPRHRAFWCERWEPQAERVAAIDALLRRRGGAVCRGGPFDGWDIEVRGGPMATARLLVAVEDHAERRQLMRVRTWARFWVPGVIVTAGAGAAAAWAFADGAWVAGGALAAVFVLLAGRAAREAAVAVGAILRSLNRYAEDRPGEVTDIDPRTGRRRD